VIPRSLILVLAPALASCVFTGSAQGGEVGNPLAEMGASIRQLTNRASKAVVEVSVTGFTSSGEGGERDTGRISRERSMGSGVIVDSSGLIITNEHVVRGATTVKVVLGSVTEAGKTDPPGQDQTTTFDARIVGVDRDFDLALLSIDAGKLPTLEFGNSESLAQGDLVFAIGSPLQLRNSLSMGVVSGTARVIDDDSPVLYIQTDASINPGDSGGALIDTNGRLVGLNTSIMSQSGGSEGISFAIPADAVHHVYEQLRLHGRVSRGSIGVFAQDVTPPLADGLSLGRQQGVMVADLDSDGSGTAAGLQRRDLILSLDDQPIKSARQFNDALLWREDGERAALIIQRGEERLSITAVIRKLAVPAEPLALMGPPERSLVSRLGLFCLEIDQEVADAMPRLRKQYGLIVAARLPESQAAAAGLRQGDVIHSLNRVPMATLDAFRSRIDEFRKGDAVALQIEREGRLRYVAFDIE